MAGDDKHMFKQFCQEGQPHVLEALSPPQTTGISPSRYGTSGALTSPGWRLGGGWSGPLVHRLGTTAFVCCMLQAQQESEW